ncbi:MAG: patatin-like phospholipase family protein, partial [Acidobacteria bacterium]|nr:patatin-like phospholipase family protein [Acidobacteriota bacterium]
MKPRTVTEHLFGTGPKRILALDGGGIRGLLSLAYLKRVEELLQQRHGKELRLCDYFDLVGGTSTGAIIAAGLALGFSVEKLQQLYQELTSDIFQKSFWRIGLIGSKFPTQPLTRALEATFGDITLGGQELRTGLVVVTKRLDTGSPWVIHNNPRGIFFDPRAGDTPVIANHKFLLRQVLRASTAAPHYFEPERLAVGPGIEGVFVDGGISPHNNPALQLLMVASLKGFGLQWPLGPDKLLLLSVGTGSREVRFSAEQVMGMSAAMLCVRALASLHTDCNWLMETLLQWMSESPTRWEIDQEIGDLAGDSLCRQRLFSYLRYNVKLDSGWLRKNLNVEIAEEQA